jgi:hypothetical protein
MALQLGIDGAYFRLGSQPAKVFLGDAVVQTVPGKPAIISATSIGLGGGEVLFTAPADGGSPILGYNVYANGSLVNAGVAAADEDLLSLNFEAGDSVEIAAVNAVGEGPRSDAVISD